MGLIHPLVGIVGLAGLRSRPDTACCRHGCARVADAKDAAGERAAAAAAHHTKPLCGAEPSLYENLRSFCEQDYPEFQLVFGVLDPADAALAVVERLAAQFPSLPIDVVINSQLHGGNRKTTT